MPRYVVCVKEDITDEVTSNSGDNSDQVAEAEASIQRNLLFERYTEFPAENCRKGCCDEALYRTDNARVQEMHRLINTMVPKAGLHFHSVELIPECVEGVTRKKAREEIAGGEN